MAGPGTQTKAWHVGLRIGGHDLGVRRVGAQGVGGGAGAVPAGVRAPPCVLWEALMLCKGGGTGDWEGMGLGWVSGVAVISCVGGAALHVLPGSDLGGCRHSHAELRAFKGTPHARVCACANERLQSRGIVRLGGLRPSPSRHLQCGWSHSPCPPQRKR